MAENSDFRKTKFNRREMLAALAVFAATTKNADATHHPIAIGDTELAQFQTRQIADRAAADRQFARLIRFLKPHTFEIRQALAVAFPKESIAPIIKAISESIHLLLVDTNKELLTLLSNENWIDKALPDIRRELNSQSIRIDAEPQTQCVLRVLTMITQIAVEQRKQKSRKK